jgi:anti-sigma regulatory factor (Ser/Thr protein kinase)
VTGAPVDRIAFRLPGGLEAAAAARRAIVAGNGRLPGVVRADVLLLVTELVTNAVRHAGAGPDRPVQVELLHEPGLVAGAVVDDGPGYTWRPTASAGTEAGGWGLLLVERIADRWGVEGTTSGSRVWFEIVYDVGREVLAGRS